MRANLHWNNSFLGNSWPWWRMKASEALVRPSWLKIIQTKRSNQRGKLSRLSRLDQKSFPPHNSNENVNLLIRTSGNLHGIFRVFTHSVGSIETEYCLYGQYCHFLQTKAIPPSLWEACDYVLQFNFIIAHFAGSVNTAADIPSRQELKVTEKIRLKIWEDVQTIPIEVTTSSSDVADEEEFLFTQADSGDETEEKIFQLKQQSRKKATKWVAKQEPFSMKPIIKKFIKVDWNTMSFSMNWIKANAAIRLEQDADLVLKNLKLKYLANHTMCWWQRTD